MNVIRIAFNLGEKALGLALLGFYVGAKKYYKPKHESHRVADNRSLRVFLLYPGLFLSKIIPEKFRKESLATAISFETSGIYAAQRVRRSKPLKRGCMSYEEYLVVRDAEGIA